jgi:hypothetical protein
LLRGLLRIVEDGLRVVAARLWLSVGVVDARLWLNVDVEGG